MDSDADGYVSYKEMSTTMNLLLRAEQYLDDDNVPPEVCGGVGEGRGGGGGGGEASGACHRGFVSLVLCGVCC